MAIRRRRKKLTNLLSTLDRRVKNLELRPLDVLSEAEAEALIDLGSTPDLIVSDTAPNQFKRIYKAFFYGDKVTGGKGSRIELFLEADTGARKDDIVFVSGVNGTSTVDLEITGEYKVQIVDSPPWEDGRASWRYLPTEDESNLSHSLYFPTDIVAPNSWTSKRELQSRRRIDSYSATTTEATITLNAVHKFKEDDIVSVDLEVENPIVFGIDGLHVVKSVTDTTITYDLDSPLEEPIDSTPVSEISERYVYPVVHEYVRDGATWIDNSGDVDLVYVWKDLRWVRFNEWVGDDGVAPAPPSNLQAEADTRATNGIQAGTAFITLTWDAPTTNAEGGPLDDLLGYEVWHRYDPSEEWEKGSPILGDDTEWSKGGFEVPRTVYFEVRAIDSGGLRSEPASVSVTTVPKAGTIKAPTPPKVTSYLETIRVEWDGLQFDSTTPPDTSIEVEVHIGLNAGFTISSGGSFREGNGTYYGGFFPLPDNYLMINTNDLTSNTEYYFKLVLTDVYGNRETSQPTAITTGKIDKPITAQLIDVGTLTGQLIIGLDIQTGPNVNSGVSGQDQSGLTLNTEGLAAYNNGGTRTFFINANTGSISMTGNISINGYAKLTDIPDLPSGLLTESDADLKYATILTTNGINTIATRADNTVAAITSVSAGVVTISKGKLLGSLNANLNANNTTTIEGGNIRTGSLTANKITSGIFTGPTFQTAAPNRKRVTVSGSTSTIKFFRDNQNNDSPTGVMEGTLNGLEMRGSVSTGSARLYLGSNTLDYYGGSSSRPQLLMGTTGVLIYGYSTSGTSAKTRLSLGTTSASLRGPGLSSTAPLFSLGTSDASLNTPNGGFSVRDLRGTGTVAVGVNSVGKLQRGISDARLKENVESLELGLDFIKTLRPITFNWKFQPKEDSEENIEKTPHFGLLAQEVEESLVNHNFLRASNLLYKFKNEHRYPEIDKEAELYGFDYTALVPILIKALKDLSNQVEELETKINGTEGNN